MKKYISIFLILIISLFSFTGCNQSKQKFTDYSFDFFDTASTIIGYETDEETFKENCEKIKSWLLEYHKLYDIYNSYDGITNLCDINKSTGKTIKADPKIINLLQYAKELYKKTDGKLNVALGSVLSIWHNYREYGLKHPEDATLPPENALLDASNHTDINDVIIDSNANTVLIKDAKLSLDVGAIAKGYAAQKVAEQMENAGMNGYLLNLGGNVKIVGKRDDGEKWQIGIENPDRTSAEAYAEEMELDNDLSLVTSGSYQRFYIVNGNNYHHIIDPETLLPAEYFTSVSVLCEDSALADGLSTALFCLNFEDGKKLLSQFEKVSVLWVTQGGKKLYYGDFEKYCK
ncbi:MAG: FAD:protein FMN transferase [Ruminococcaceae bacterium]|nr:FAD:protein FMN transferase [Oscillospiraceae bacterium]